VTVTAVSINSDGVPNNATPIDQDFALVIYNAATPAIITSFQPTNLMVLEGQTATFTVTAIGSPPLKYQWFKDGSALAGATASSFSIPSAQTTIPAAIPSSLPMLMVLRPATSPL